MSTRRLAVLGSPIAHSKSPLLHTAAYQMLCWDASYQAFDINESQLPAFLDGLDASWRGLSLTMPLKHAIQPYLTEQEATATLTGVVNTVVFDGESVVGANTDVDGIVNALDSPAVTTATVFGSGATAISAVVALQRCGADHIILASRRGRNVADKFTELGVEATVTLDSGLSWARRSEVTISTLPAHVADAFAAQIATPINGQLNGQLLLDVAYAPWPSMLAARWQACGGSVVSGLDMLVEQAIEQVRRFVPSRFPSTAADIASLRAAMYAAVD